MIYIKVCYLLYNRHNVARISLMKQIYDLVQIEVTKAMAQSMGKARLQVSRSNFQKLSRGTTEPGSQTFSKAPAFSSECCRCGTKNERETKSKLSEGLASERWDSECRRKPACDAVTLHVHLKDSHRQSSHADGGKYYYKTKSRAIFFNVRRNWVRTKFWASSLTWLNWPCP